MLTDEALVAIAQEVLPEGLYWDLEPTDEGWVAHLASRDGPPVRNYGSATHDRVLAVFSAEQRYLVEQVGTGAVEGTTYLQKAQTRVQRLRGDGGQAAGM